MIGWNLSFLPLQPGSVGNLTLGRFSIADPVTHPENQTESHQEGHERNLLQKVY